MMATVTSIEYQTVQKYQETLKKAMEDDNMLFISGQLMKVGMITPENHTN